MLPKPTILLVDDLEENLVALEALLRSPERSILRARSGREALELLLTHEVALALLDVRMPEMDGFELAELMRGSERTREVPIVFVTAGGRDPHRVFKGYEAGAIDFLFKPLDPFILQNKVAAFIQLYRQKQQLAEQLRELTRVEEQLRHLVQRKNEFLAVLSHELRNPLAPIRNSLYILDRTPPGSERATRAKAVIDRQVEHLTRLVSDLLDVTRIDRGKIELHRERIDLLELVRRCLDDHQGELEAAGLALGYEPGPDGPVFVDADPVRLEQALGNLLSNAAKFTPAGGRVDVRAERAAGEARVRVRDNGVGMAPEMLGSIFEPFTQIDRTLDRSRGGLGLGLAVVKGVVELHGGTVAAASRGLGQGTEFTLALPAADAVAPGGAGAPARAKARRRRVMVIDDDVHRAASLRDALESMGHEVALAASGADGLAAARAFAPDVVLCDLGLPEMDGFAVARRLRTRAEGACPVLVALTGDTLPEDQRRIAEAGFTHQVATPPDRAALAALLDSVPAR